MSYHLSINMAITLDGKTARPDGKWYGLCSRRDRTHMDELRGVADAVIIGKNSVIHDDPVIQLKYASGNEPKPVMIVRNSDLPSDRHIFQDPSQKKNRPLVFCTEKNHAILIKSIGSFADIVVLGEIDINPSDVLDYLENINLHSILLEGGPRLNQAFLAQDLVHTINLTLVPYIIGLNTLPAFTDGETPFQMFDQKKWSLKESNPVENELFLIYEKNF